MTSRRLGYAETIVATGRSLGISARGIKIGLATALVETNILNYANRAVPGSLTVPYDAIGSDSKSVGLFQQQPQWWGRGDGIDLMDPATSARLFFEQLAKLDYNNTSRTPGWYAQTVQRSAYPDRYDQRFAEASALYDQITTTGGIVAKPAFTEIESMGSSCQSRNGQKPRYIFVHTQEGGGTAQSLAGFLNNPNNGASYHYTVDNSGVVVDVVDTDLASWSVGDANSYSINLCFAGSYAGWSRQQWLTNMGRAIDIAAYLVAQDCKKYGIAAIWLGSGGSYRAASSGVSDHQYVTNVIGWGSHTDVGKGFPGDVFAAALAKYVSGAADVVVNQIDAAATVAKGWIGNRVTKGENVCPDKVGRWAEFEHAHIYWTPQTGAHPIPHGGLFEAWAEYKWETGPLGYPVRDHAVLPDGGVQAFQGGVLYRHNGSEHGYYVHGAIGSRYAADGYEKSDLGWPTSNEYKDGTGISQDFEHGTLHWEPTGVVKTLNGKA